MTRRNPLISGLTESEARLLLTTNFDLLVHDLSCHCEKADPSRASGLLGQARWTVKDAYEAWSAAWMRGDLGA